MGGHIISDSPIFMCMRRNFDDAGLIDESSSIMIFRDAGMSHAKVKARDIVSGWPQGRSTIGGFISVEGYLTEQCPWEWMRRRSWTAEDYNKAESEVNETVSYHIHQDLMVRDWRLSAVEDPPGPGYWMNETGGKLQPAIRAFLSGWTLDPNQIQLIRAYLLQWIWAPVWKGTEIDALRSSVKEIHDRKSIDAWLAKAEETGIDPL